MKWVIHCMLYAFLWVPVEALLLSTWGTTPGKWLMKTTVTDKSGNKLRFPAAFARSLYVWSWGLGIGFPYATLIGEMFSYLDLRNKGTTRWDAQWGYRVRHERIGSHRVVVAVLLYALFGVLLGFAADAVANSQSVGLTGGLLALFALAISWLLIVDLATAEEN